MLPGSSIMSRWQTKKFTTQDSIIYVLDKSEHNMASGLMMFIILSHDLLTSESKATFNPHCGFSVINGASHFNKDTSIIFKQ